MTEHDTGEAGLRDRNSLGLAKDPSDTRVLVAMSGGVDSSVVAGMLVSEGYDVVGMTLQLNDYSSATSRPGTCCAGRDITDARRVAETLSIPHYVLDYESRFKEDVIDYFIDSYLAGMTPVPCIRCNQGVKFRDLLETAKQIDADCMATGHYVRRLEGAAGAELHTAVDASRDQSYFLFATNAGPVAFPAISSRKSVFEVGNPNARRAVRSSRRPKTRQPGHLLCPGRFLRVGNRKATAVGVRGRRHCSPGRA